MNARARKPVRHPARGARGVTLIELVMAMALMWLLCGCFYATMRGVSRVQASALATSHALVLFNNVLERVDADARSSHATVRGVFADEFAKSALGRDYGLTPRYVEQTAGATLLVVRPNGKTVMAVDLKVTDDTGGGAGGGHEAP